MPRIKAPLELASRIRVARAKHGLTLDQVALAARCSVSSLMRWEAGKTGPASTEHGALAAALRVPLPWLLHGDPPAPFPIAAADDPVSFAYRLREARVARGFTQAELAALMGVGPVNIVAWEAGESGHQKQHTSLAARVLNVRTQWLNGRSRYGGPVPPR